VLLALLGTVTGFAPLLVTNPRMGLAAHVGGIMNALLLLALGAAWSAFTLPRGRQRLASRLLVVGAYGNWAITLLASITGAKQFAPLAGAGYGAAPLVENATLLLITLVALCTLGGLGLVVSGLGRRP
jgi:hydroxylaminobenzene mutase